MTFHKLKYLIRGYNRISYIFFFFQHSSFKELCSFDLLSNRNSFFLHIGLQGTEVFILLQYLSSTVGECYMLPGLESVPLNCLKTKGLITQRSVCKTKLMSPEKTTSPSLSLFSYTCIHKNSSSFLCLLPKKKHRKADELKCFATMFTLPLYNTISLSSEASLNMESEIMQLNFNTCLRDMRKYKYVHKVWLERNELIFISHKILMPCLYYIPKITLSCYCFLVKAFSDPKQKQNPHLRY